MNKRLVQIMLGTLFFIAGMILDESSMLQFPVYLLGYLASGYTVILKAFRNILGGRFFEENFLMSLATLGAFAIREYPEAIAVMLFYQVGEYLQDYAVNRSRKSITSLMDIRPDYANLKMGDSLERVNPEQVAIGDLILVKSGERVPLDGVVVEGRSHLDVSALTGESLPLEVEAGSTLLSGSINLGGILVVRVASLYGESTVSRILELVENASAKKSRQEQFITRFARYYTPAVVIIGLLLAFLPPLVDGGNFDVWIYRALAFLVVSCPCALVVSVPLSFFAGIGGASKAGILVKGANSLEALAEAEAVVFDKTGTLTKGVFEVHEIKAFGQFRREEILEFAAHAEAYSDHPVSESIRRSYSRMIDRSRVGMVREIPGTGIVAEVDGRLVLVGSGKLMEDHSIQSCSGPTFGTLIQVAIDGCCAGSLQISDEIKEDAAQAVADLKKRGIRKVLMLTGDSQASGGYVAEKVGLDGFEAKLLPEDKVRRIEALMAESSGTVIFVGDGINDAPVLARSDVGIAMGGLGRDAAIEAADIVVMKDEPSKVAHALGIAKKTVGIARMNIFLAVGVKMVVLGLSALGLVSLWAAVFADVGVTVLAVFNALRALNTGERRRVEQQCSRY